jgi:hypothetical protein
MKRRTFMAMSAVAGLAPLAGGSSAAAGAGQAGRDYYRLQQFELDGEAQKKRLDAYLRDAAIPALNRLGIRPVGVFYLREAPQKGISPTYVLLPSASPQLLLTLFDQLLADAEFVRAAGDVLDSPTPNPGYKRLESSLMVAFKGMPHLDSSIHVPGRVFQLRTYESPSVKMGKKKIEMFNDAGEIAIFHRVGLRPVFFGETLIGSKMPNLTYMLGFDNAEEQKAAWNKFRTDPGWLKLRGMPEYADKTILCGITNLLLKPADYSQI